MVVAASLALGGCGGDGDAPSATEYEASVVNTRDRVDFALAQIQQAQSPDDFLARLEEAGSLIDEAAADFEDTGAPERFEDESERLARHLGELSAALAGTATQAREVGFEDLLAGASGLNFESWDRTNATLRDLQRQGVDVQPLQRH